MQARLEAKPFLTDALFPAKLLEDTGECLIKHVLILLI